jgi:hypothetical protein
MHCHAGFVISLRRLLYSWSRRGEEWSKQLVDFSIAVQDCRVFALPDIWTSECWCIMVSGQGLTSLGLRHLITASKLYSTRVNAVVENGGAPLIWSINAILVASLELGSQPLGKSSVSSMEVPKRAREVAGRSTLRFLVVPGRKDAGRRRLEANRVVD